MTNLHGDESTFLEALRKAEDAMNRMRIKAVIHRTQAHGLIPNPRDIEIVDIETGRQLPVKDVALTFPLDRHAVATVELILDDVEVVAEDGFTRTPQPPPPASQTPSRSDLAALVRDLREAASTAVYRNGIPAVFARADATLAGLDASESECTPLPPG